MVIVFLQVAEQVEKGRFGGIAPEDLVILAAQGNVLKQGVTQCFQQIVLGLEMGIKGGSADVRPGDNIPHGDLGVLLFGKQVDKRLKNGGFCFSLSSVHSSSIQFPKIVHYRTMQKIHLLILFCGLFKIISNKLSYIEYTI